jgi:pimeloyl-ACP methyl ester carboxylesterase
MKHQASSNNADFKGNVTQLSWQLKLFVAALQVVDRLAPAAATQLMLSKFVSPRRKPDCDYTSRLPAGARRVVVDHNQTALTAWAWGETGPALLVVHGWESHTGRMLPLIKPLVEQGYRVVALDAPGHGMSPAAQTDLLDVSYAVEAALAQHGPFDGVISHSFGAAATAVALARAPHLAPEKVVLLAPMRDLEQHVEIFADIARLSPAAVERLKARIAERVGMPLAQCGAVTAVRVFDRPGLVIHDCHDLLIPYAVGQAVAENWRGARFVGTNKLGHRRGLGNTAVITHILDYLAGDSANETGAQTVLRAMNAGRKTGRRVHARRGGRLAPPTAVVYNRQADFGQA